MLVVRPFLPMYVVLSIKDFTKYGKDVLHAVFTAGGIYTLKIPVGVFNDFPKEILEKMTKQDIEFLDLIQGSYAIQVVKEVFFRLSEDDQKAALLHEEGHIFYDHLNKKNYKTIQGNVVVNVDIELEADAYAAAKIGKRKYAISLLRMIENMVNYIVTKGGKIPLEKELYSRFITSTLLDPYYRKRFEALNA